MTRLTDNIKTFALIFTIACGFCLQASKGSAAGLKTMVVAGGCFWCVESDFEKVKGVKEAVSGFAGGKTPAPTYKQVTQGGTGHYEAVQITYDPAVVSYDTLLNLFLRSVDPTDAGGQFCDRGDSYRTAIFVSNKAEESSAKTAISEAQATLGQKIVTPVLANTGFYPADESHQNYAKGSKIVITRFGPRKQSVAYQKYRSACGRDARVKELWGSAAPFAGG